MCLQAKRRKYTYMSMCSCCHVLSRYSSAIKTHLLQKHSQHLAKKGQKMVIPVRIDSRYERHIHVGMSLDRKKSSKDLKCRRQSTTSAQIEKKLTAEKDKSVPQSPQKRTVNKENSILCTICKKRFDSLVNYFAHLSRKDHRNTKLCFKCIQCDSLFQTLTDLINHNKKHKSKRNLSVSQLDCFELSDSEITRTDVSRLPCPYCLTSFQDIEHIYKHIGDIHRGQIDVITIKTEEDDETEHQEQKTVIAVFKCKYCNESFHPLSDIVQHVSEKHIMTGRQARKRTLPKWLKEHRDDERSRSKKKRNDSSSTKNFSKKDSPSKNVVHNLPRNLAPIVVLENIEYDVDSRYENRNSATHKAVEYSEKIVHDGGVSSNDNEEISEQNEGQKEANDLDHDYYIKNGISGPGDEEVENTIDQNESSSTYNFMEESLIAEDTDEDVAHTSDSDYKPEDDSNFELRENRVSKPQEFNCPYCEIKQYPTLKSLNRHIKEKHPDAERFNSKDFHKPEEKDKSLNTEMFKCPNCENKRYPSLKSLNRHIKEKHPDAERFNSKDFNKRKSDQDSTGSPEDGYKPVEKDKSLNTETFKCSYCEDKEYRHLKSLNKHIKMKHPGCETRKAKDKAERTNLPTQNEIIVVDRQTENSERKDLTAQNESIVVDSQTEKPEMTESFDETFEGDSDDDYKPEEEESNLESEEYEASKVNMFECEYCEGKEFIEKRRLLRHMKLKHPDAVPAKTKVEKKYSTKESDTELCYRYKCPFCTFSLHHREYVFSHIEIGHPEVLHFTIADIVKEPVTMKKSEINRECFQCPSCDFICRWKADLKSHLLYHHPGQKLPNNIPCILPGTWVDMQALSAKLLCPLCKTVVEGKENLEKHLGEHVSDKGYNISFCSSLPEPDSTGKRIIKKKLQSFLCPYCDCVFKRKDSYHGHLNTHEGGTKERSQATAIKCMLIKQEPDVSMEVVQHADQNNEENENGVNRPDGKRNELTESTQELETETEKVSSSEVEISSKVDPSDSKEHDSYLKPNKEMVKTNVNVSHDQTKLIAGSYICPVCDDFKTSSKELAVKHVEGNHRNKISEIEILYLVPHILVEGYKKDMVVDKNTEFIFGCNSCTFSSLIITDALKHVKKHRNEAEFRSERHEDVLDTGPKLNAVIKLNSLFEIVSSPNIGYGSTDELYKCWSCHPYYLLKTRRGYRKHMKMHHEDAVGCDIGDVMNQILEVMEDKEKKRYVCSMCSETMQSEQDLVDHFSAIHPEKVDELVDQLNNKQNVNNRANLTAQSNCEICHASFSDVLSLRRHLLMHVNKFKTHCPTCGVCFGTKEEVATHLASAHSKHSDMCSICGQLFCTRKDFVRHVRIHKQDLEGAKATRMLCQHCGTEIRKQSFRRHLLRYHANHIICECDICIMQKAPTGVTPLMCNLCNRVFCTNFYLTAHLKKDHVQQKIEQNAVHGGTVEVSEELKCFGCGMLFDSHKHLLSHSHDCDKTLEALEKKSQLTNLDGEQAEMSENEGEMNEKVVLSANISSDYIKENFLEYNRDSDLPYTCRICRRSFRVPKYMYEHVRRKHGSDESRRFRCKVCKMGFNRSSSLKVHCKRHIGLRPHQCKVCKKSFKTITHLREHTRIHTDAEAPQFTCGYCGNKFIQSGALMAHVIHHDKLRPYKCPFCQRGFTTTGDLKRHMDKYDKTIAKNGLKCSFCKKTFSNFHYLLKHFQTHTIKDPFHCTVCEKKFSSFRQMYQHKNQNKHFTESEYKQAREDLLTPGRLFRGQFNRKTKAKKISDSNNKETALATSVIGKAPAEYEQESKQVVFEEENCVEVEIPNSFNYDETTKDALSLFQNNVIESMIDVVRKESDSDENDEQVAFNYEEPNQVEYVVEVADFNPPAEGSRKAETLETQTATHQGGTGTDIDDLASLVAQNVQNQEMGKTQTYQTPDGSFIHVCVIKPAK